MVKKVLDNGLTVLIEERPASPIVALVTYVKTGYFDEPDEIAGISHVFEHMFFKGTTRRPDPEDIAKDTKALGGILNAGTGYESTSYYTAAPVENFGSILDIQFDALTDPLLDSSELQKEIEVVIQESRQKLDNPAAYSLEKMWEAAFDHHRIRRWRIGQTERLRTMTRDDLSRYYSERYCPQNIILCIVGGLGSGTALRSVEKLYSGIPIGILIDSPSPSEGTQKAMKYSRLKGDINQKLVHIGFHAPTILDADYYPLSIATDILGGGKSSRLYQSLKERQKLVSSIGAYYSAYRDTGVLTISTEAITQNPSEAIISVFEEIEKLKKEPIRRDEMEKIKNMIESDLVFDQEQALGRANRLAYYEALGDWRLSDESIERLVAVDTADVARVTAKYLSVDHATVLEYVPEDADLPVYDEKVLKLKSTRAAMHVPNGLSGNGNLQRAVMPSGATLITEIDPASPVVGLAIYFKGGRIRETPETAGITELTLRSSLKGTAKYSAEEIAKRIESLGTSFGICNSSDYFGYSFRILAKNFEEGLELLSDVIVNAGFIEDEVEKEKEALRADIRRLQDSSFSYASDLLAQVAFPSHPYGLPDYGQDDTVAHFTRDQVAQWHSSICLPEAAVVSIVGDIHLDSTTKAIEEIFHKLKNRSSVCVTNPVNFPAGIQKNAVSRDRKQTAAALGFPGVAANDPGRYALDVTSAMASGLGGRLFAEVRGRRGLAYVVSSANHSAIGGGLFVIYTATSPENEDQAREAVFGELQRLRLEPAKVEEVERAKNYIKGAKLIALQTAVARSRERAINEIYGRELNGTDEYLKGIARVTPDDIVNASREYFTPSRYYLGVVQGKPAVRD